MASRDLKKHVYCAPAFFPSLEDEVRRQDWALLILNQPIMNTTLLRACMRTCGYKICADGGANRLFEAISAGESRQTVTHEYPNECLPDLIHGDLDSLRDDVRKFYSERGVEISLDGDQYSTDFGKALRKIYDYTDRSKSLAATSSHYGRNQSSNDGVDTSAMSILVLGTISGRVDQGLGLLSEMIREQSNHPDVDIYLIGESSFSFLLRQGENIIDFSTEPSDAAKEIQQPRSNQPLEQSSKVQSKFVEGLFTPNVGILPIAGRAVISTKGLEWDVENWETIMGGQVSTSNHLVHNILHIWTDRTVLFTVELSNEAQG